MSIVNRSTLRSYFETGDTITSASMTDLIDSGANLADSSAQAFQSEISAPDVVAAVVSASALHVTGLLQASAATFTGRVRQGVNTGASATTTLGDMIVAQEATVANTTAQVAFLPTTSNIVALKAKVMVGGSAGAGGLKIVAGITGNNSFFGTLIVSAAGLHEFVLVSARNLTGVSGAVTMIASGASANTNIVGVVTYYQRV